MLGEGSRLPTYPKMALAPKSPQLRTKNERSKSLIPKMCAIAHKNWPFNKNVGNCAQKAVSQKPGISVKTGFLDFKIPWLRPLLLK